MPVHSDVGVIITCHNDSHVLSHAIESAMTQSYPAAEFIVVDDGYADGTRALTARYPNVRYSRQPHRGLAAARNHGIRMARSTYVVFLDATDRLVSDHHRISLETFAKRPEAGFVCGDYRDVVSEDLGRRHECEPCPDHYATLLMKREGFLSSAAAVMFRRQAVIQAGAWREDVAVNADLDVFLRVANRYPTICHHEVVAESRGPAGTPTPRRHLLQELVALYRLHQPLIEQRPEYRAAFAIGFATVYAAYAPSIRRDIVAMLWRRDVCSAWLSLRFIISHHPTRQTQFIRRMWTRSTPEPVHVTAVPPVQSQAVRPGLAVPPAPPA